MRLSYTSQTRHLWLRAQFWQDTVRVVIKIMRPSSSGSCPVSTKLETRLSLHWFQVGYQRVAAHARPHRAGPPP